MRDVKRIFLVIALFSIVVSSSVWAHGHRHSHSHLSIGLGYYGPGYYGGYGYGGYGFGRYGFGGYGYGYPSYYFPPAYAYPPTVIVPATPPVYIEQQTQQQPAQSAQPTQSRANYWYYCKDPDGYYPYVRECPGGWLQVAPQPPGQ